MTERIRVIDSHTAGEPTRLIVGGGPSLGGGTVADQLERFRDGFDRYRTAVVKEPRGWDVLVGAILCPPQDPQSLTGVIFFNNVDYLGMCGHGMMGVVESLRYLGRAGEGEHRIETPVGAVTTRIEKDGRVSIRNVDSYRKASNVQVHVDGIGQVVGDVAWGGNWFFLAELPDLELRPENAGRLQQIATDIRSAVAAAGYPEVDHIELFGKPQSNEADAKNFVLCPGHEYDRSPCGTGTSAKLACLAADGKLSPGDTWVQEGILDTRFRGRYQWSEGSSENRPIVPTISGSAFVTADSQLILDPQDPFCWGR